MTKNQIIEKIYRDGLIHNIVKNISHGLEDEDDMMDLVQDISIILLSKDDDLIIRLYENNELQYYIANIVYTQLRSTTSPYYRKYKHYRNISTMLDCAETYLESPQIY